MIAAATSKAVLIASVYAARGGISEGRARGASHLFGVRERGAGNVERTPRG